MLGEEGDDDIDDETNDDNVEENDEVEVYIEDCKVYQCHVRLPF